MVQQHWRTETQPHSVTSAHSLTFAEVHQYEDLPYVPRAHRCDTGVQITDNILVTHKVFLQGHKHTFREL